MKLYSIVLRANGSVALQEAMRIQLPELNIDFLEVTICIEKSANIDNIEMWGN